MCIHTYIRQNSIYDLKTKCWSLYFIRKLFLVSEKHLSYKIDRIEQVHECLLSKLHINIGIGVPSIKDTEQIRDKRGLRR